MGKPKKDVPDPEDVHDIIQEEQSRGRRPIDTDARRRRAMLRRDFRELLRIDRRVDFEEAILDLGIERGSQLFEDAVQVWNFRHKS